MLENVHRVLLINLGGSDPRRRRRWAADKPVKVGSLPPKMLFLPCFTPTPRLRSLPSFPATYSLGRTEF